MLVRNGTELKAALPQAQVVKVKKNALVYVEPLAEEKTFEVWGQTLVGKPGVHYQLYQYDNPADTYPIEIAIFDGTPEKPGTYQYRCQSPEGRKLYEKPKPFEAVVVPEGVTVEVTTLETADKPPETAEPGDYIGIGPKNEIYVIRKAAFDKPTKAGVPSYEVIG